MSRAARGLRSLAGRAAARAIWSRSIDIDIAIHVGDRDLQIVNLE